MARKGRLISGEIRYCDKIQYEKDRLILDAYWNICGKDLQDNLYSNDHGYSEPFPFHVMPDQTDTIKQCAENYFDDCAKIANIGKEEFTKGVLKKYDEYKKDARQLIKNRYLDMLESISNFLGDDYVKAELGFKGKK